MTARAADLEVRFRWLSVAVLVLYGVAFAVGLLLYALEPASQASLVLLHAGLLLLMASPAVRILVAIAERTRRQDWRFLAMTVVVLAELGVVLWRAATRS